LNKAEEAKEEKKEE